MSERASRHLRRWLRIAAVTGLIVGAIAVRVLTSAAAELRAADQYRAAGAIDSAVVHYRRAARWYAPASPFHVEALAKLGAIGAQAERDGDSELALSAYRAIRAAIMSTRSLYIPEQARLRAADERIASLMAALPPPPMDAGKTREQIRDEHLALLRADPGPNVLWTVVLLFGFGAWVAGAFAFTLRAIDERDRLVRREAVRWGALIAVGFGLFVLGMSLA